MNRAVFLDRDGVINPMVYNTEFGLVDSPANPDEFRLMPDAAQAIRDFHQMGFIVALISNQPGIAKGKFSPRLLDAITDKMIVGLAAGGAHLDAIYYCKHHPEGTVLEYRQVCDCRKPKPGMLLKAAQELNIDLSQSYFIGDGITDVQAGQAAGTKTILIYPSSKCYLCTELNNRNIQPDFIVANLLGAVAIIQEAESFRKAEDKSLSWK